MRMAPSDPSREEILAALDRVLGSPTFQGSERSRNVLRYLVEKSVSGSTGDLKEYTIGLEVLGRGQNFDPRTDPIVRAEVSRLRQRLDLYYATLGKDERLTILLPKGTYSPRFEYREATDMGRPQAVTETAAVQASGRLRRLILVGGLSAIVLSLGVMGIARFRARSEHTVAEPFHLDLDTGGLTVTGEVGPHLAISPDGTNIAMVALSPDGYFRLYLRNLTRDSITEIPGTNGARGPFFSPDGAWIGFWSDGKLKKTSLEGGNPITLCEATDLLGGSWGDDGWIVGVFDWTGRIYRVPENGGAAEVLADLGPAGVKPAWIQSLHGGGILFTSLLSSRGDLGPADGGAVYFWRTGYEKPKLLFRGGTYSRFGDGHLLYVNRNTLFALRFDPDTATTRGSAVAIVKDVESSSTFGYAQYDLSASGTLVYHHRPGTGAVTPAIVSERGKSERIESLTGLLQVPRVSPDGKRLAVAKQDGDRWDIWTADFATGRSARQTSGGDRSYTQPVWSPDGRFLLMNAGRGGIVWKPVDSDNLPSPLIDSEQISIPWSFSPDGSWLAFHRLDPKNGFDLWIARVAKTADGLRAEAPTPFLRTPAWETYPTISPDGRWIAYGSNESGAWQVYVRSFPEGQSVTQVSQQGGRIPAWSSRNRLIFRTDDQRIFSAHYRVERGKFVVDEPVVRPDLRLAETGVIANFDVLSSGDLIVLLPEETRNRPAGLSVILNLPSLLAHRLPPG